jgi:hypothetical protein
VFDDAIGLRLLDYAEEDDPAGTYDKIKDQVIAKQK